MQTVTTIGLDIAKSVFQVHGVDAGVGVERSVGRFPPTYGSSIAGVTWLKITTPIRRIRCR
jgi:hypothetical protein